MQSRAQCAHASGQRTRRAAPAASAGNGAANQPSCTAPHPASAFHRLVEFVNASYIGHTLSVSLSLSCIETHTYAGQEVSREVLNLLSIKAGMTHLYSGQSCKRGVLIRIIEDTVVEDLIVFDFSHDGNKHKCKMQRC